MLTGSIMTVPGAVPLDEDEKPIDNTTATRPDTHRRTSAQGPLIDEKVAD